MSPDEYIELVEYPCYRKPPEEFAGILRSNLLYCKKNIRKLRSTLNKEEYHELLKDFLFATRDHLNELERRFGDDPNFPFVKPNRKQLLESLQLLKSFLEQELNLKKTKQFALNNFCAAVFVVLTQAGLHIEKPGRGRNVRENEYKKFAEVCKAIIGRETFVEKLDAFNDQSFDRETIITDLNAMIMIFGDSFPRITDRSDIADYFNKWFGYPRTPNSGTASKSEEIQTILSVTTCNSIDPFQHILSLLR